jgi:septal ring factor EnvC (AmiA/AmiB activator)
LEQIQALDQSRAETAEHHREARTARDGIQRSLGQAHDRQLELEATLDHSRSVVSGGSSALWKLRGREALSGLLGDADRARSARTWRNLGLLVRYATATMQVHSSHLEEHATRLSILATQAAELRDRERRVEVLELDLAHEEEAKRALLASVLAEREQALEISGLTATSLGQLLDSAPPRTGSSTRPGASQRAGVGSSFAAWKGRLPVPVEGRVVTAFGEERDAKNRTVVRSNGIRFAVEPGTPVHAAFEGQVVHRGYVPGLGNVVILEHGGDYFTVYGHLSEVRAAAGSGVARGEPIGLAGSSGVTDEPALYFEIRRGGVALDPREWLASNVSNGRRAKGSRGRT